MPLRGFNLSNWLLMEGYLTGGRNIAEHVFKKQFEARYGKDGLVELETSFRKNWIREEDLRRIGAMGATLVRLPFHSKLIEPEPYRYDPQGVAWLKRVLGWAARHGLKVLLDLHAAPGSQNADWHSDSEGRAQLWEKPLYRKRTLALWEYLADQFRNAPALYGYDLLNEPMPPSGARSQLLKFYREAIQVVRGVDKRHEIVIEGHTWSQQIDFLAPLAAPGITVSVHTYKPEAFTFYLHRGYRYPGKIDGRVWNRNQVMRYLKPYKQFSDRHQVPILVGEFGFCAREVSAGAHAWLEDMLSVFEAFGFHWTYWPYKSIPLGLWPDGLLQYPENPPWVHREGPLTGWETWVDAWQKNRRKMIRSWRSDRFHLDGDLDAVFRKFLKPG